MKMLVDINGAWTVIWTRLAQVPHPLVPKNERDPYMTLTGRWKDLEHI